MDKLEEKISLLKEKTVKFANLVESMITDSVKGLMNKNEEMLNDVMNRREDIANDYEIELDEMCMNAIAFVSAGSEEPENDFNDLKDEHRFGKNRRFVQQHRGQRDISDR